MPAAPEEERTAAAEAADLAEERDPDPWPRVLEGEGLLVKLHPPQVDSWDADRLVARGAVELSEKDKEGSTFGVISFSVRTRVDKDARLVVLDEYQSVTAEIPSQPGLEGTLLGLLQKQLTDVVRVVSLDRVETALAASGSRAPGHQIEVKNEPPEIVFAERPTLLVAIDGEPAWRLVEGTSYERLLNTRPLVLRRGSESLYLHLFDGWLRAEELGGPWRVTEGQPAGLAAAAEESLRTQSADLLEGGVPDQQEVDENGDPIAKPTLAEDPIPDVLVSSAPTEVVVSDGAPEWIAIPETDLEFVENTTGNLFRNTSADSYYVLLSGRWFEAGSLDGPWGFVPQEKLPGTSARYRMTARRRTSRRRWPGRRKPRKR